MAVRGGYDYASGSGSNTVSVPSNARVLQITVRGGETATMDIDGKGAMSVYPSFTERPEGSMVGPFDIVFASTNAYVVSWVA